MRSDTLLHTNCNWLKNTVRMQADIGLSGCAGLIASKTVRNAKSSHNSVHSEVSCLVFAFSVDTIVLRTEYEAYWWCTLSCLIYESHTPSSLPSRPRWDGIGSLNSNNAEWMACRHES